MSHGAWRSGNDLPRRTYLIHIRHWARANILLRYHYLHITDNSQLSSPQPNVASIFIYESNMRFSRPLLFIISAYIWWARLTFTAGRKLYVCMYVCMYVCTYVCVWYVCMYVCMCVYGCVCMYVCMYVGR